MNLKSVIRLPAKAGAWYVASGAMIKLCGMSATPYFTRVMSPEEYGRYSLYMSLAAILSVLTTVSTLLGIPTPYAVPLMVPPLKLLMSLRMV